VVGKTLSARYYAHWDEVEPLLPPHPLLQALPLPAAIAAYHAIVYTPTVTGSPARLAAEVSGLEGAFARVVEEARPRDDPRPWWPERSYVELLIVDEADRLRPQGVEHLRDVYDRANQRGHLGLVLIGLPGIEKRLARYPQMFSRVGFVHHYRALSAAELHFVVTHKWAELGLTLSPEDFADVEAVAAIARITGGNFRLVQRLFAQIARVVQINELRTVTAEVVEAARESLVIGPLV
jgi:DNA transposition AAA+ family ATPase